MLSPALAMFGRRLHSAHSLPMVLGKPVPEKAKPLWQHAHIQLVYLIREIKHCA
jgi:hypothetical protein